MIERCGFPDKWRWFFFCISTVKFSILIKGVPCGFFESSKGIRQGDPFSPLLFVNVMDAFSKMLDKAVRDGLLFGVSVASMGNSLQETHLLFPDDALVLCDVVLDQILLLRLMLLWFEIVSRLKINMGKSELGPVGVVPN